MTTAAADSPLHVLSDACRKAGLGTGFTHDGQRLIVWAPLHGGLAKVAIRVDTTRGPPWLRWDWSDGPTDLGPADELQVAVRRIHYVVTGEELRADHYS